MTFPWDKLPTGKITPLALLVVSVILFEIAARPTLTNSVRVTTLVLAAVSFLLCLRDFTYRPPCKVLLEPTARALMCDRDLGFLVGVLLQVGLLFLPRIGLIVSLVDHWRHLHVALKFTILALFALPTIVHGSIRRLLGYNSNEGSLDQKLTAFAFGLLASLIAALTFLELESE